MKPTTLRIVLALIAAGAAIGLSLKPWQTARDQKQRAEQARAELRKAEADSADMLRKEARFESPAGREEMARERGYRPPGEKPLEVGR